MANEIYDEISEDLRQQELEKFWKENRNWIIGGVVGAVLFTGALSFWREYKLESSMKATAALTGAMDANDPSALALYAKEADKDHALLAKFAEAQLYAARKEGEKAAAVYDQIADMSRIDKTWRDLARLYAVGQRLDNGNPEKLHEALAPLRDKTCAFRFSAEEMSALLYVRQKKTGKAAAAFAALADDEAAPRDIRARAATLRDLYAGGKG